MVYVPLPVRAADLGAAVQGLRALGMRGANVTIPHKGARRAAWSTGWTRTRAWPRR